ncbi:MAG: glycoside hydrolase family 78 protein [Lachnospiraceae bacterium]|nr:glycoside hydrolase family 78 protein [Lachnospiraceae bacterium]
MRITRCKTNHIYNPMGINLNEVHVSWQIEDFYSNEVLKTNIVVKKDDETVYETGFGIHDHADTFIDIRLIPRTEYSWKVLAKLEDEIVESETNYFETGKIDEKWIAKWISCDMSKDRHPVFVKDIDIKKPVKKARLYICGLGLYVPYWNDKKIGENNLAPYCNNYSKWIQAQTYDVSETVKESGELKVELGYGWYLGRFGFNTQSTFRYGDTLKLICELYIDYEDGSKDIICSDESWKVKRSNIIFSNIYDGEKVDDTLNDSEYEEAHVLLDENKFPVDSFSIPVKEHEVFEGKLIKTPKGEDVFDIGQNIAGIFEFRVHEPKGTVIRLQAGEVLVDDCFYRDNLRSAKAEYIYVSDGNEHVLKPKFTFYGYRYMRVSGAMNLKQGDFKGIALYSDFETIGEITTGNEKINRLILNSRWGMKGNFIDVPTDCPQRDERMGWTGDAQVFSGTALYFSDVYAFYRKYLHDMEMEQDRFDGMVPIVVPSFDLVESFPMGGTSAVWGDATTIIPWNMYLYTGDKSILKEHFDHMKAWVNYIKKVDGNDHGWRRAFHFGDWLALDGADAVDAVKGGTDDDFIADIYYMKSALIVSESAKILGFPEDEKNYKELAEKIKKEILNEYYSPNGKCAIMTQTGEILSITNGLGDDERSTATLIRLLENNRRKLKTGFVGTPFLNKVLSDTGNDDMAYSLLFNEEYPGWLYEVNMGATTIWERWNSVESDGSISSTGMNSLNHYSYGAICQWIFERCAGISVIEPGFKKAKIAPLPHVKLKKLDMTYDSSYGKWTIKWKLEGKRLNISVNVPYGCTSDLILPDFCGQVDDNPVFKNYTDGVCHLESGEYSIAYDVKNIPGMYSADSKLKELLGDDRIKQYVTEKLDFVAPVEFTTFQSTSLRDIFKIYNAGDALLEEMEREIEKINL